MTTVAPLTFGLSTHVFHGERLTRRHFERAASHGFRLVEVFATLTHFDYHDRRHVADVRRWLDELGMMCWSLHAPICDGFVAGVWGRAFSNATTNTVARQEAIDETRASIEAARLLGCSVVVLHLGIPRGQPIPPDDNNGAALARSLEPIAEACTTAGIKLALEVIPNDLATPGALLEWLDGELELGGAATCLDVGHAHLVGGAPEAAEMLAGYVVTTHIHDNRGRVDEHLVPFDGTIDWPATMTALFKIGYAGPLVFELPDHGDAERTLRAAASSRRRLQAILDDLAAPLPFTEG